MDIEHSLPPEYKPFEELIICGNTFANGLIPFDIEGHTPLLIGKGEIASIWLDMLVISPKKKWVSLIKNSQTVTTIGYKEHTIELKTIMERRTMEITFWKFNILFVEKLSETKAVINQLDLRPLGLNIYGTQSGLTIGENNLVGNTFTNVTTMVGIGPPK